MTGWPPEVEPSDADRIAALDPDETVGDAWDQWPNEAPRAYSHFEVYRNLGRGRTVKAAADASGQGPGYLYQLASKYGWVRRAAAWDNEQARAYSARMADERFKIGERHLAIAGAIISKGLEALRNINPATLGPRDLLAYLEAGMKWQRLAAGDVTERLAVGDASGAETVPTSMGDEDLLAELGRVRAEIERRESGARAPA